MPDSDNPATLRVGTARVTILNAGDLRFHLAEELAVPEAVWRPQHAELFEKPGICPSLSAYIEQGDARILVDVGDYRATVTPGSEYALDGYTPPPGIPTQLARLGAAPEDITHVVITHAHWDHYAGVTTPGASGIDASGQMPTFPLARYCMGAADWADAEMQSALSDPTSLEARTLGALMAQGALHLAEGPELIADGVELLPAPGETPGHLVVRVHAQGETLYIVGDLFHHAIEVEHPDWMVGWADSEAMLATRRWLLQQAHDERALLVAAHIFGAGRIQRVDADTLQWATV
ncbi:MAG TPA: MBL fold metallo-hydrolase [Ktedonobacterales bacterium]|nr:MBL fold metallo-hydrolase [Ktedonobacterales bacterium]